MRSGEEAVKSLDKALCGERVISEATTRTGARSAQAKTVSHFMKATVAIEFLRAQHGEANARKIALKELRKATRARSRRRFDFGAKLQRRSSWMHGRPELVDPDLKRR
jgi:hypothetical protein